MGDIGETVELTPEMEAELSDGKGERDGQEQPDGPRGA